MSTLDAVTLARALNRCRDYPNYRVCNIFKTVGRKMDFLHTMYNLIRNGDVPDAVMVNEVHNQNTFIRFQNGSTIESILCDESMRGRRYHEVLTDFEETNAEDEYIIGCLIMPYSYNEDTDVEDDTAELDEFLNSFTVQQNQR